MQSTNRQAAGDQARLAPAVRAKLIGALNLLASPHLGEAAAAAGAVVRIVQGHDLAWDKLLPAALLPAPERPGGRRPGGATDLRLCRMSIPRLSEQEQKFVADLSRWSGKISEEQGARLAKIADRLRRECAR